MPAKSKWVVYLLRCANGTLYTGITNNLTRRIQAHNGHGKGGARYTRAFGPVVLAWSESKRNRSSASKREAEIKRWPRSKKLALVSATGDRSATKCL